MPVRWRFLITARDERTGEGHTLVDDEATYPISNPGKPLTPQYAVFLANELMTRLNGCVEGEHPVGPLPYLGVCRGCGRIVDDLHLLGSERDICDACWVRDRRD